MRHRLATLLRQPHGRLVGRGRAPVEGWRTAQEALGESTGSSQAAPAGSFSAAVIQRRNLIGLVDLSRPEGQQLLGWFEGATLRGGLGKLLEATDF
ncbi:MAG TPA: hypothetical protein VMW75_25905 [Thermoanaerobaculia bacterium]|nr:hypothetical protein [Thermoanaerobaculia bacterium]